MIYRLATSRREKFWCDAFLALHNGHGFGSSTAYKMYYCVVDETEAAPMDRIKAVAKFSALHTPAAAKFFGGDKEWRHVYILQRLAASGLPENGLSQFLGWALRQQGKDQKVHFVCTYADTGLMNQNGIPHNGGIYRATNAVYCGKSKGGNVYAYELDGATHHLRKGKVTMRVSEIPARATKLRSNPKHRYAWAVGSPLQRKFRYAELALRMRMYHFTPEQYQPRLLLARIGRTIYEKANRTYQRAYALLSYHPNQTEDTSIVGEVQVSQLWVL